MKISASAGTTAGLDKSGLSTLQELRFGHNSGNFRWRRWTAQLKRVLLCHCKRSLVRRGECPEFSTYCLEGFAGHPDGRASVAELTRFVRVFDVKRNRLV